MGPALLRRLVISILVTLRPIFRRVQLRLSATVGCRLGQPDGDADQILSAKLGIATGKNLAEQIRITIRVP